MTADAVATALFVMGTEEGLRGLPVAGACPGSAGRQGGLAPGTRALQPAPLKQGL